MSQYDPRGEQGSCPASAGIRVMTEGGQRAVQMGARWACSLVKDHDGPHEVYVKNGHELLLSWDRNNLHASFALAPR